MARRAPGDIVARACTTDAQGRAAAWPGASRSLPFTSLHLPSRELNPISSPCASPLVMQRSPLPGRPSGALPGAFRFCSFPSRSRATRTTSVIIIVSFRKGANHRFAESAGATSGASRIREAGEPGLRPPFLKGKSPPSASGRGGQLCRGRALVVATGPLQRDLRKRAPLFRAPSR